MKLFLLKILLQRRARDEGFTLPLVIAIGLILVLLSVINVVQSSEENLSAISQEGTADALAMAEIGIARYRELINRNRVLAVYNRANWSDVDNTAANPQVCDSNVSTLANNSTWQNINDGTENIGSYRIVDYTYDNDNNTATNDDGDLNLTSDAANDVDGDGESDAKGILTVQGQAEDGSVAQIQVEIPLGINTNDLETLRPALWVQQNNTTDIAPGNLVIYKDDDGDGNPDDDDGDTNPDIVGNIVLYRPAGSGGCVDPADIVSNGNSLNTIGDPRILPPFNIPTGVTPKLIAGDIDKNVDGDPDFDPDPPGTTLVPGDDPEFDKYIDRPQGLILGTNTDNDDALNNGVYYYQTASVAGSQDLIITDGQDLVSDGEAKVIVYVDGDINISGNVDIENSSGDATSRFLEIHTTGDININGSGTVNIKALLHAPNGTVNISESATVNITGSVWANNWNNTTTGTVTITRDDYKFYSSTGDRTPQPLTYRPDVWEKQEAQ